MSDRIPLRIEEIRLDPGDRFPLTVDADGMPSWWPNLYCSIALRTGGMGLSTMQSRMNAVCLFHDLCDGMGIDIGTRIESLELLRPRSWLRCVTSCVPPYASRHAT